MFGPSVAAWVKEPDNFVRVGITTSQVRAFVQIAVVACKREIFKITCATMLARVDVLDVEWMRVVVLLVEAAVLAAIPCAMPHLLAEGRRHYEVA